MTVAMIGTTISHYRIKQKLGQGGMGEVFLADDLSLDREVALKFLPESFDQDPVARKRFLREAKAAAALDHPYICHVHEAGEVKGKDFIVMEFVEGQTLKEKLADRLLPLMPALQIAAEIAEALEEAHEKGIIHRDLKPANIMLTRKGHAKVMDFGLAKQVVPIGASQEETLSRQTKEGATLGTLAFMSPEQLRGQELDFRSDIFSFGIVLYEMLAGVHPFKRETALETGNAILKETQIPIKRADEPVSALLQHIVRKMLAKDPGWRYQHIQEVRIDLAGAIQEIEQPPTKLPDGEFKPRARPWNRWRLALPILLAGLALGAGIKMLVIHKPSPQAPLPVTRFAISLPTAYQTITSLALSPDGRSLAFMPGGWKGVFIRKLSQLDATPIRLTEGPSRFFFSPDGKWIGFWDSTDIALRKVSITQGGSPVAICSVGPVAGATWGDDGTIIIGQVGQGLMKVPEGGGAAQSITTPDVQKGEDSHRWPHRLPGGEAVLFTIWTGNVDDSRIGVLFLKTGKWKTIWKGGSNPMYARTGHLLYLRSTGLMAVPFDLSRLEVKGEPVIAIDGVSSDSAGAVNLVLSNNGTLAYVPSASGTNRSLVRADRSGAVVTITDDRRQYYFGPRVSPDGQRLVICVRNEQGINDLWLYDLSGGPPVRLTHSGDNVDPVWTSDGRRIIYAHGESSHLKKADLFWILPDDATRNPELLFERRTRIYPYSCSRSGEELLFVEFHPFNANDIWTLPVKGGGQARPLFNTKFSETQPVFSPDGRWIAYLCDRQGTTEVFVSSYPDLKITRRISFNGGKEPRWSHNGKELYYLEGDKLMSVSVSTEPEFRASTAKVLFGGCLNVGWWPTYDVGRDGQFFMIRGTGTQEIIVVQNWFEELKRLAPFK